MVCAATTTGSYGYFRWIKAFKRSRLWEPESWPDPDDRPRMGAVIADHIRLPGPDGDPQPGPDLTPEQVQSGLDQSYAKRLWSS